MTEALDLFVEAEGLLDKARELAAEAAAPVAELYARQWELRESPGSGTDPDLSGTAAPGGSGLQLCPLQAELTNPALVASLASGP